MESVALHLIATNKYIHFVKKICESANIFFFPDCKRHIIVYTNLDFPLYLETDYPSITFHFRKIVHEKWPFVTLKRFHYFTDDNIINVDYDFYCDVDSKFIRKLSNLELPMLDFKFTVHPLWVEGYDPNEKNTKSTAYIPINESYVYVCGGFFGARHSSFIEMALKIRKNIDTDLNNSIIACNNDESHINKYYYDNPHRTTLFYRPFAIGEGCEEPKEETRIIFIEKAFIGGHNYFRE